MIGTRLPPQISKHAELVQLIEDPLALLAAERRHLVGHRLQISCSLKSWKQDVRSIRKYECDVGVLPKRRDYLIENIQLGSRVVHYQIRVSVAERRDKV